MKISTLKAIGFAALTALVCMGCTDSGDDTGGREVDVFLDRADGTTYTLTLNLTQRSANGGSVTRDPIGPNYTPGQKVTVTASPYNNNDYRFKNWTGDTSSTSPSIIVTMDNKTKTLTADFERITYTITANASPSNYGSVVRRKSGNNSTVYYYGDRDTLTARPANAGYKFTNWSDGSTDSTRRITVTSDTTLIAYFEPAAYTLIVTADPSDIGSVSRNPSKTNYSYGEKVRVTATVSPGYPDYEFKYWVDAVTGASFSTPDTMISMDRDWQLTAIFGEKQSFTLAVTENPSVGGSTSRTPASPYFAGDKVTVTASANVGYQFTRWSGASISTDSTITITMNRNETLTAYFEPIPYTLTIDMDPDTCGTVSRNPDNAYYYYDERVTVTATPAKAYRFMGWTDTETGLILSRDTSHEVRITRNRRLTANFAESEQYIVTFDENGGDGTPPDPIPVEAGSGIDLPDGNSLSNHGYIFVGWNTSPDRSTGTHYDAGDYYEPDGNVTLYAIWEWEW
jgi:hypothetical protein